MVDLTACLGIWLGEPTRRTWYAACRRAARRLSTRVPAVPRRALAAPDYAHLPASEQAWALETPLDGDAFALVRPYVLPAVERKRRPALEPLPSVSRRHRQGAAHA
ncbi:hypothetical protein OHB04_22930 [Streptomyces sp. NBC_01775]|uniref:hypothetical protein n=1 Tax=Streptomyces sp. NBC_01775 TaxID=2975939 RepID=UPI002DD99FA1|nr:hypothetical protein [Streptomyces sp. NBC_01775]WSB78348.1 hypothetical protein OHB04_22930 [Streptomyces sp. NBC_01775]